MDGCTGIHHQLLHKTGTSKVDARGGCDLTRPKGLGGQGGTLEMASVTIQEGDGRPIVAMRLVNLRMKQSEDVYRLLDMGSNASVVSQSVVRKLGLRPDDRRSFRVKTLNGTKEGMRDVVTGDLSNE